jgi:hypothetical protein
MDSYSISQTPRILKRGINRNKKARLRAKKTETQILMLSQSSG